MIGDIVGYLHAASFGQVKDTVLKAIANGHFAVWPQLTVDNVTKDLQKYDATMEGHLNQQRQNINSTQPPLTKLIVDDSLMEDLEPLAKRNFIFVAIVESGQIYSDLIGRFPTQSASGNNYTL
jgi:hypothetical protein